MIFRWRYLNRPALLGGWIVFAALLPCVIAAQSNVPGQDWETVDNPQALGWSADGLERVQQYAQTLGSATLLIVTQGKIVFSWGDPSAALPVHGVVDSVISTLFGIAQSKGLIDVEQTLAELAIDDYALLTEQEKQATVAHLLQGRSGVYLPASSEAWGVWRPRAARDSHQAGASWLYNVWGINALATIFEQSTDRDLFAAYQEWLAEPIGMQDYRSGDGTLIYGPTSEHPAYRFRASARDLARLGQLVLREGQWQDNQVIPAAWLSNCTQALSKTPLLGIRSHYGCGWWVASEIDRFADLGIPDGTVSAYGVGGHRLIVLPDLGTVVVHLMSPSNPGNAVYIDSTFERFLSLILDARLPGAEDLRPPGDSFHRVKVPAPALANNLLNTPTVQPASIFLPPDYDAQSDKRYPVIYLLPHFRETVFELLPDIEDAGKQWTLPAFSGVKMFRLLHDLMHKRQIPEMIVVIPNSHNVNYGSFYVDSPVSGNWESFIRLDLVTYVDKHYRTLADAASRGIAGHGMGGFGALRIAMQFPDTFSTVYALTPWALSWTDELGDTNPVWLRVMQTSTRSQLDRAWRRGDPYVGIIAALGTAFSPNPKRAPLFVDWPFSFPGKDEQGNIRVRKRGDPHHKPEAPKGNKLVTNKKIHQKWLQNFPVNMIPGHRDKLAKLNRIVLEYGTKDVFANAKSGAHAFSRALGDNGIPNRLEIFDGVSALKMRERLAEYILPFFANTLHFDEP